MLPKAVRSRKHFEVGAFIEDRAGDRTVEVAALLAEHYGRAAALGREGGLPADELATMRERGVRFLEEAGDAAAMLYSNREAASHYRHARKVGDSADPPTPADESTGARIGEKLGDVSVRLGRVDEAITVWRECLDWHRGQEDLERVADLHRKIGSGLSHKGERKAAIEHYQKGINLLKDGPPRLELVRLYEEAAWLYLHTGDNMLAIYASEKALRLAERLGETSAASRAHGIFGRVFGRIGNTEKARQNLERAVELARGSDDGETILALSALGRHLEISEADVAGAREAFEEALALAEQVGALPAQVELHASLAQLAAYAADWERVRISTNASAELAEREGLVGKLSLPYTLRGLLLWREGRLDESTVLFQRAHDLAEQVGWSELAFQALYGLAFTLRDSGDLDAAAAALDRAIDVCERAGLIAQSIQATGMRAVILAIGHRRSDAREAAEEASELAESLHYPVGNAAALGGAWHGRRGPGGGRRPPRRGRPRLAGPRPAARGGALTPARGQGADHRGRGAWPRAARRSRRRDRSARRATPGGARAGARGRIGRGALLRLVGARDHHDGGVAGQTLALGVDPLALTDPQPPADDRRLAPVTGRVHDHGLRPLLVWAVGHRAEREAESLHPVADLRRKPRYERAVEHGDGHARGVHRHPPAVPSLGVLVGGASAAGALGGSLLGRPTALVLADQLHDSERGAAADDQHPRDREGQVARAGCEAPVPGLARWGQDHGLLRRGARRSRRSDG